jgi:hypothetical protein
LRTVQQEVCVFHQNSPNLRTITTNDVIGDWALNNNHIEHGAARRFVSTASDAPEEIYRERTANFASERDKYTQRWSRVANVRLALFALTLLSLGLGLWRDMPLLLWAALPLLAGFVAAVVQHRRLARFRHRYDELWQINAEGLKRLRRDWASLPLRAPRVTAIGDPLAIDLDLLGHASLQHLLNTAYTPVGQTTLERWLLGAAAPEVVCERQAAVAELASLIEFRDELALRGRRMSALQSDYEAFVRWAEAAPWLARRPALIWAARLLPLAAIATLLAWYAGWITYPLWALFILANMGITFATTKEVDAVLDQVSARQGVFRTYADIFHLLRGSSFTAPRLRRAQAELMAGDTSAENQMRRLQRIMALADLRMWLLYPPIQWLTLWNIHVLWLLERWQRRAGKHARVWLDTLGEVEALAALGTLKHDHPHWAFPELVEQEQTVIVGRALGHPLLAPHISVPNDVEIGPPGQFLLVTGSNMSGKSTLLRAIGVNIVLAQAGGPVSALLFRLPPTRLATSMRVQDSLEHGVSYFLAELKRLKSVVDAAEYTHAEGARTLVFLLDEILHGTNTAERQIAARAILRHLLGLGATGAVSTHDLTLVDTPALASRNQAVYFTETFTRGPNGPEIAFDHKLRPGIATTTNALKLMEIVGLRLDGTGEAAVARNTDQDAERPQALTA